MTSNFWNNGGNSNSFWNMDDDDGLIGYSDRIRNIIREGKRNGRRKELENGIYFTKVDSDEELWKCPYCDREGDIVDGDINGGWGDWEEVYDEYECSDCTVQWTVTTFRDIEWGEVIPDCPKVVKKPFWGDPPKDFWKGIDEKDKSKFWSSNKKVRR